MSRRFLFAMKAPTAVNEVLKALAAADMVICTAVIAVVTDDDAVAALLDKLDTAERIETAEIGQMTPTEGDHAFVEPKKRKPRKPYTGELVECPKCHLRKAPGHMTKSGICKVCHMRELKAEKITAKERAPGQWTSAMPKSDGHHQENLVEMQSRPKHALPLNRLKGHKVG